MTGLRVAVRRDARPPKFLTLTSSNVADNARTHDDFRALTKRLRSGKREYSRLSGKWESVRPRYRFAYMAVMEFTASGLAHLHVLFRGAYIPLGTIQDLWYDLHGAYIADIGEVRNPRDGAKYAAKYIGKESDGRYWYSWEWAARGLAALWLAVRKQYGADGLAMWQRACDGFYVAVTLVYKKSWRGTVYRAVYAAFGATGLITRSSLYNRLNV